MVAITVSSLLKAAALALAVAAVLPGDVRQTLEAMSKGGRDEASVEQGGRVGQGEAQSQQAVQQSSLHTDKARKFKVKREGESSEQQHKKSKSNLT